MITDIAAFMLAGGQRVPATAMKTLTEEDKDDLFYFQDRLLEEFTETNHAIGDDDVCEVVDGFLDAAYVAFTGALRVGGVAGVTRAWEAILRANTSKIDGSLGPVVRDEETGKILKPEGWTAPDIEEALYGRGEGND